MMKQISLNFEYFLELKNPLVFLLVLHIIFNVFFWNFTSRIEYRTKFFSNLFGNKKVALYINSLFIFSFGLSRDFLYKYVVNSSSIFSLIDNQYMTYLGYILTIMGSILVIAATYKLKVFGTYNADAFGFPFPSVITSFPYNIFHSPMYVGSTLNFLGYALIKKSFVGLVLTILVAVAYYCGTFFEE